MPGACRLAPDGQLRHRPQIELTLVDRHDYHQAVTELPRVAAGTRAADAVRIPLQDVLATRVRFARTEIDGFDLDGRRLLTGAGPIGWGRLVLAPGSRPNDFAIPGGSLRTAADLGELVELRGLEPLASCMPCASSQSIPVRRGRTGSIPPAPTLRDSWARPEET
jgi:NADPH-dependent 2,4-dienoyl-CoA reductase/sulfur reductase-like enzyme